jgi:hypothetical protein
LAINNVVVMELISGPSAALPFAGWVRISSSRGVGAALIRVLKPDEDHPGTLVIPLLHRLEGLLVKAVSDSTNLIGPFPFGFCHFSVDALLRLRSSISSAGFPWEPARSIDHLFALLDIFVVKLPSLPVGR